MDPRKLKEDKRRKKGGAPSGRERPALADLQRWMRWAITHNDGLVPALEHRRGEPSPSCLNAFAKTSAPLSPSDRLDLHVKTRFARLLGCLEQEFPALKRVLGEALFESLISEYLRACPSGSFITATLGRELPGFLQTYDLSESLPYLPDLARLEWSLIEAFRAPDLAMMAPGQIAEVPEQEWPQARLFLCPSLRLLYSRWNIDCARENPLEPVEEEECWLMAIRTGLASQVRRIDPLQFRILEMLQEGILLGALCERLEAQLHVDAELPPLKRWFQDWAESGVIRAVVVPSG